MGARARRCLERHGRRAAPAAVAGGGRAARPIWPASRAEPPRARSTMNFDERSLATGEPAGELRRWQTLGLLPMEVDAAVDHRPEDRIRLIQFARRRGCQPERIAAALREQPDLLNFFEELSERPTGAKRTLDKALAEAGVDRDVANKVLRAAGLGEPAAFYDDGIERLRRMAIAVQAGFPIDPLLPLARARRDAPGPAARPGDPTTHP